MKIENPLLQFKKMMYFCSRKKCVFTQKKRIELWKPKENGTFHPCWNAGTTA